MRQELDRMRDNHQGLPLQLPRKYIIKDFLAHKRIQRAERVVNQINIRIGVDGPSQ